jgi:hypothetical protein
MGTKRASRITVDLLGDKQAWLDLCKRSGMTPSDAIRSAVGLILAREARRHPAVTEPDLRQVEVSQPEKISVRKKIGLTRSEANYIEQIASAEGFSSAKWIVALIRARLTNTAQFGQAELEALAESNLRLLAIGRNLNQVARALNTSIEDRHLYRIEMIEALSHEITKHAQLVSNQMTANVERWRVK